MDEARKLPASVLSYFDLSPGGFPWRDSRPQQIERRRAALSDLLLFDILLTSGGIRQPDTLYPPVDVESFNRLLEAIQASQYDALKKDCLVYFLLKWYQDGREERFSIERCIPPQFARLADAYWHLDAGMNVSRAVSILSDARLNTDYASKILQAISLSPQSMALVLKYVRTAKPHLTEPDDLDIYTIALAESSLLEAWQFQRTFSEKNETRPRLLKKILDWCFTPVPRRSAVVKLLGISLTPFEQSLIQSYATPPSALPPAGIATLQNLICVRLIQTGKYADAIKMDRQFSSASSVNLGPQAAERTKMILDLYAALPTAERAILDLELENQGIDASTSGETSMSGSREWDVSMSWEDIRPPVPSATPVPIPPLPAVQIPILPEPSSALNGAIREPLRSKFGGFGGSQHTSAFPPLALSTSSSSSRPLAPIIPISTVPKGSLAVQPAIPSVRPPLNAFSSLSQSSSTSRFAGPSASSPSGASKSIFDSAGRKQNAFYQPPAAPPPVSLPAFSEAVPEDAGARSKSHEDEDIDMDHSVDFESETGREEVHEQADDESLAYSVFGGKPVRSGKRAGARTRQAVAEVKQVPPGAFVTDDEHESEVQEPPPPPPARQTRRSAAAKTGSAKPVKSSTTTSRTRARAKEPELGRSLPGSLMDSEDGSAGEEGADEDGDRIAPLPRRQAVASEGVQTRRRSSRLSSSEAESKPEKEKAPARTRTATRKRRT
ncbi:nuclear pore complex assembly-domain-containing protein [Mycena galericulata]|nr:nuclear pore complex assembly-domain-containing protein [Mycena galericulata]